MIEGLVLDELVGQHRARKPAPGQLLVAHESLEPDQNLLQPLRRGSERREPLRESGSVLRRVEVGRQCGNRAPVRIGLPTRIAGRRKELYGPPAGPAKLVRVELDFLAGEQYERDFDDQRLTAGEPRLEPGQEGLLRRSVHVSRIRRFCRKMSSFSR